MLKRLIILFIWFVLLANFAYAKDKTDTIYQISTINALLESVYDTDIDFKEIKKHGNLGLGTLNGLNGELIGLDGKFYTANIDGKIYPVTDNDKTPFTVVTFFKPDKKLEINDSLNYSDLKKYIDSELPTNNIFYAFKINGSFKKMKVRSIPEQKKPYPPLVDVVKHQKVFELSDVKGTIVGFKCPEYAKEINVADYHFHFLSDDKKSGGHILDFELDKVNAEIDYIYNIDLVLPQSEDFYNVNLYKQQNKALHQVETESK
ncbi:MAG: acetolactate decarboxylase [Cyanobacteriota bacterium]